MKPQSKQSEPVFLKDTTCHDISTIYGSFDLFSTLVEFSVFCNNFKLPKHNKE